jgi:hypothetical protein
MVDLAPSVRRQPDRKTEAPSSLDWQILLTDVHEVGAAEDGEVGPVVDDQRDAEALRDGTRLPERLQKLAVGQVLLSHLHEVDPPAHRGGEKVRKVGADTRDEVEAAEERCGHATAGSLAARDGASDDELVPTLERDLPEARSLDGLAVALDQGIAAHEAETFEENGDRLAALELLSAAVDGDHAFEITPVTGLDGAAVSSSSMIPAR